MSADLEKPQNNPIKTSAVASKFSELKKRTLTALVVLPIVIAVMWVGGGLFQFAVALLLVQMLREFYAMQKQQLFSRLAIGSILLSGLCCLSLIYLEDETLMSIAWLACVITATDIGAYFTGRAFGRHKIWVAVSPNKTWEGAIGGFALAALVSSWFGQAAIWGVVIGVVAQLGDFAESSIKRKYGVKDSGNLLPGHGGILDRMDSYLFAAPLVAFLHLVGIITW